MDGILWKKWWTYDPAEPGYFSIYHGFNLIEGAAWCVVAVLIAARYLRNRCSSIELIYAASFATFAWSDFREAFALTTWLILFKGVNLAAILALRRSVLRRFYPSSRTY